MMIDIRITTSDDAVQIDVSGELNFATAGELHAQLCRAMDDAKQHPGRRLRLVLGDIGSFDLVGVQLLTSLCSAGRAAALPGVEIVVGEFQQRLERMMRFAGLAPVPCLSP